MRGARNQQEIGKLLKHLRQQQNLSQAELARKSGLTQPSISNIEHGAGGSLKHVEAILRALNLELILEPVQKIDTSKLADLID